MGQALGCEVALLDGGISLIHPTQTMRAFNCVSCWSPVALPALAEYARRCYPARQRPAVIALTDRLPRSAHALLTDQGWQPATPRQLFMQRPAAPPLPVAALPIQPLSPALIGEFVGLVAQSFGWDARLAQEQRTLYERQVAEQIGLHYVALLDGVVVATASIVPATPAPATIWGIYKVTTRPDQRGRGLATALLSRAIDDAQAAGADTVFLYTAPDGPAVSLYRRLGFTPLFMRTCYLWPDHRSDPG